MQCLMEMACEWCSCYIVLCFMCSLNERVIAYQPCLLQPRRLLRFKHNFVMQAINGKVSWLVPLAKVCATHVSRGDCHMLCYSALLPFVWWGMEFC